MRRAGSTASWVTRGVLFGHSRTSASLLDGETAVDGSLTSVGGGGGTRRATPAADLGVARRPGRSHATRGGCSELGEQKSRPFRTILMIRGCRGARSSNCAGAISRDVESKLMFPWSDCRNFLIFLLGVMYRTRLVLNRVNPGSRKIRRPTAPIQNPSFSADHRGRLACVLRLQIGPADASGSRLHGPHHRHARGDPR